MKKQRQQWHDETHLQDYIAALEQENALLRAELDIYQLEKQSQERIAELARVNAVLQVEVAEYRRREQVLQGQIAIAREQEKAAQERAAELAKANDALKRSLDALAADSDLNQFIGHVLKTVAEQLDAPVVEYWSTSNNTAYLELSCWQGKVLNREQLADASHMQIVAIPQELAAHEALPHGQRHSIIDDLPSDPLHVRLYSTLKFDLEAWCNQHKVRRELNVPLRLGANTIGTLCVYVPAERSFTEQQIELSYALAQQVTLAVRLTQLAEEAKQAALAKLNEVIAREQEKAAREQAAELAEINAALEAEVSERARAERLAHGQTEALIKILTALVAEPVLDNFLGCVLQSIADQLGDPYGGIWLYNETYNTTILHINYENGEIQRGVQITRPGSIHNVIGQWDVEYVQLLREQRILIQDVRQLPDVPEYAPYRAYNQQHGIKTILVIPLFFGETFLGNITLRSTKQRNYQPEELELARVLAYQATLAIQLTHLSEQSRQSAVLEERNRLAREIHDTIAQGLTGIVIQLQAAQDVDTTDPNDQQAHITQAGHLAEASLAEARRSVWALRPRALEGTTLADALTHLGPQLTMGTGIHAICRMSGTPYPLPSNVETHLLRIAQEAVNNTLKHAKASEIQIELIYQPHRVQLRVQDNGQGFDPTLLTQGYGLLGIQERSHHIGATLTLSSQPGVGTDVQVQVPTG